MSFRRAWRGGIEAGVQGNGPHATRPAVEMQVGLLFGWRAENVIDLLLSNRNGPDERSEQEAHLLNALTAASKARQAIVLSEIDYRQQADCPALQPATSGLD
jgi:hypothetical protein